MIWIAILIIILAFQFVVIFLGAPYVPTLHKQREIALDLLKLKPGQTLIDLGSGDGAMLKAAAQRGINVVGYEINPLLVFISRFRTRRYAENVKIIRGNFWQQKWPEADAVFVFLTGRYMERLNQNMQNRFKNPVKLVTYGFSIPNKKPKKADGACFLYRY
jgi:16S rRNA A1518/A1519 N6-dimethyltransferase RsmA/KsgA/DIM1 with predicted DNA glycosylase/AP lyase activity